MDDPRASMTVLSMVASVGQWFMILSFGWSRSHAICAFASLLRYVRNSAMVAVAGGKGLCGRMGTGCITGFFAVSL